MQKKLYILIGAVIVLGLAGLIFWVVSQSNTQPATSLKEVVKMDCATAQVPFACYLDKAMAAQDPNLCLNAGSAKRLDCLEAYKEILAVEVACTQIQNPDFQRECLMTSQDILPEDESEYQPVSDQENEPVAEVADEIVDRP